MKRVRSRIAAALIAIGAVTGLGLVTAAPAQAATITQYCNWPNRAVVNIPGNFSGKYFSVTAYSPGGAWLGQRSGYGGGITWYTPWEDVRFVTSGYVTSTQTWCG